MSPASARRASQQPALPRRSAPSLQPDARVATALQSGSLFAANVCGLVTEPPTTARDREVLARVGAAVSTVVASQRGLLGVPVALPQDRFAALLLGEGGDLRAQELLEALASADPRVRTLLAPLLDAEPADRVLLSCLPLAVLRRLDAMRPTATSTG